MKIKKIKLKNIRSYEEQEIVFPEGSLLLAGDVGSGKTSILLAIEYALFGLQPGQTGSALLRNNCIIGEVTLEIESEGQEIIIERKLKRGSKSVTNEYASITINGEKREYSITELKTKVLNLLGYPAEFIKKNNLLYKYTVYTPQEQMKQIILEDPETRLNVLRHIFGIDKYKIIRENVAILLNRLKDEIKSLQIEIKTLDEDKSRINIAKESVKKLEINISEKERELEEKKKFRRLIESELLGLEENIRERDKLETELEKSKVLSSTKNESLFEMGREIYSMQKSLAEIKEKFNEEELKQTAQAVLVKKIELDKLNARHIEIEGQLKNFEQMKKENLIKKERVFSIKMCPTCLQDVPEAHKHNILNETEGVLAELKKKTALLLEEKQISIDFIERSKIDLIQLEERKFSLEILKSKEEGNDKTRKKLQEMIRTKESLEKDILMLKTHMETLKEDVLKFSKFTMLYKVKQEELKKALIDEKNSEISAAETKKEIELTNKQIDSLLQSLTEKESAKIKLSARLDLMDWLSNQFLALVDFTERNVLMKLRNEFSKLFSKWFKMLAGESFEVQLDENFTPLIMQGEVEMDYSFLSGGERTAVALAYRLALNQTINSVLSKIKTKDIVILDEPTDGFSDLQIDKMRDVFDELNVGQLIIVSHEQKIDNFVDSVLRLKKDNDITSVEMPGGLQENQVEE